MPRGRGPGSSDWLSRQADIDVYREFRRHHLAHDKSSQMHALSRLSTDHARRCAIGLVRASGYAAALDPLLAVDGLRAGLWLKMMHRVISLGFDEVFSCFAHIAATWEVIAAGRTPTATDVLLLQKKCPKYSESDAAEISALVQQGRLFPGAEPQWYASFEERLKTLPTLIMSLDTFFDDFPFMEQFVPCIYHLVEKIPRKSCNEALRAAYTESSGFEIACRRLFVFALRNFIDLPPALARRKDHLLAKQRPSSPDEEVLHAFAIYAHQLGFASEKIAQLQKVAPEMLIAKHALLRARKAPMYQVEKHHIESVQRTMFKTCQEIAEQPRWAQPRKVVGYAMQRPRCLSGFPDLASFERDRDYLNEWDLLQWRPVKGPHVADFFRLRSLCYALFGILPQEASAGDTGGELPEADLWVDVSVSGGEPAQTELWEEEMPVSMGVEYVAGGEAREYGQEEPGSLSPSTPCVFFKTLQDGKWTVLRQVQPATWQSVESAARELCHKHWNLIAIDMDGRIGSITPADSFNSAMASGINTLLAFTGDYDINTILHYKGLLY